MIEFKFRDIEEDWGIANRHFSSECMALGIDVSAGNNWQKPLSDGLAAVIRGYADAGKFESVIELMLEQFDTGGMYELFEYVSDRLIEKNESDRLRAMWRALIRMRKSWKKSEGLLAMQHFANVLKKAGDEDGFLKIKQEIEVYSSDVKIDYPTTDKRKIDEVCSGRFCRERSWTPSMLYRDRMYYSIFFSISKRRK